MHLKMSSAKWRPSCVGLNMLIVEHMADKSPGKLPHRMRGNINGLVQDSLISTADAQEIPWSFPMQLISCET